MSEKDFIKRKLEVEPLFRERKNKNKGIAFFLKERHGLEISVGLLSEVISEALTMDRYYRKAQSEYENLRGSDYGDKEVLSQIKQSELGYEVGHNNDIKQINDNI